ncbi:hypothetical protein VTO42DRAFT_2296 [Malbranchea cinnamomea]
MSASGVPRSPSGPSKRRKIQLACQRCRDRKTRCDGGRPACGSCERRGLAAECVYDDTASVGVVHQGQISALEERVSRLERREVSVGLAVGLPLNDSVCTAGIVRDVESSQHQSRPNDGDHSQLGRSQSTEPIRGLEHHGVDGLATINVSEHDQSLYGGSSTIAFVRSFASSPDHHGPAHRSPVPRRGLSAQQVTSESAPIRGVDLTSVVYPPRWLADDYLRCFWEFMHPLFPVLHKTSFMKQYEEIWSSNDPRERRTEHCSMDEVIFSSIINILFALGCKFSGHIPASERASIADDFYQRSRKIFVYDPLDSGSVQQVQFLLLNGVYLQSTRYANRCWNAVGLAIRVAQSLGMHLDQPDERQESQVDREMRRRIWHTCVILDKLLAMTFGRPTMVSKSWSVPLPCLVDDEHLEYEGEGRQPPNKPSRIGLLVCSSRLFEILDEILSAFYSDGFGPGLNASETEKQARGIASKVLPLNRRLETFIRSVPHYLRIDSEEAAQDNCTRLQSQVLYCRFLYTRILLLRPLLLLSTKFGSGGPQIPPGASQMKDLDGELIRNCCELCFETAIALIDNIYDNLETAYRSSGWHSVYFTFAAATILLACLKCPVLDPKYFGNSFESHWDKCLLILQHYQQQIQSASQAISVLQNLKKQVEQDRMHFSSETALPTTERPQDIGLDPFNPYGIDSLSEIWFGQLPLNTDWPEFDPA